jgi:drug/metabolite transporter (DMT)-like permease
VRGYDLARLLGLAGIWSLQYIFLRVAVPVFGTAPVAEGRALFGALFLVVAASIAGQRIGMAKHWRAYLELCILNNVVPFACFAYAASVLPAGYLSIINGTVPLWTAVFAAWLIGERLGGRRLAGFVLGLLGVALTVNLGPVELGTSSLIGAVAGLVGSAAWGWAGVLIKQRSAGVPAIAFAAGSIGLAAALMAPLWLLAPPPASWTLDASAALLGVGTLCSGLAYLALFTLVRDIGPSRTLSVGFLVPVLGVLWGWLLLNEEVTAPMILGGAFVLVAMALVLRR